MKRESFRKGMKDGVPIALGYFAVSFTFGMMAVAGGLRIWQAVLISLTNLTSAGQFAGLDIIFAGGSMWEMAMTQLIINLRYCLMSFSLSQKFRREESGILKYIAAFGITDEIFGISAAQEGKVSVFYNYGAMCVAIPGWTLGTLAGGISGSLLPDFMLSAFERCHLRNVPGHHHPAVQKEQTGSWGGCGIHGSQYCFCGDTGVKTGIIRIYDHYHNTSGSRPGSLFSARWKRKGEAVHES